MCFRWSFTKWPANEPSRPTNKGWMETGSPLNDKPIYSHSHATQKETAHPHPTGERRSESHQGPLGRTHHHHPGQQEGLGVLAPALPQVGSDRINSFAMPRKK